MVMVLSDGCRGLPNVGYNYLHGSEAALCQSLSSLTNTTYAAGSHVCSLHVTSTDTIDLRLSEMFAALMGSCSTYPTALSGVFDQAAALVATLPASKLNATMSQLTGLGDKSGGYTLPSLGVVPRPPLLNVIESAGVHFSSTLASFVSSLGGTLSCDALYVGHWVETPTCVFVRVHCAHDVQQPRHRGSVRLLLLRLRHCLLLGECGRAIREACI